MKNLRFGLLAAMIAIGMSSFSAKNAKLTDYYYQDSGWQTYTTTPPPCPTGNNPLCTVQINGQTRQLFLEKDVTKPVKRN